MKNLKTCPYCAAEYEDTLPACPFCGTMNYKGAEAEYLEKLEDVRSDMEALGNVPGEEAKRELRRQGKFLKKLLLILGIVVALAAAAMFLVSREPKRDEQADYLWKRENYPVFDEMYANGEYEALAKAARQAVEQDLPFWEWEHSSFCEVLEDLFYVDELLDYEADGGEMKAYHYENLLYYGWKMQGSYLADRLTEEELKIVEPYTLRLREDFKARWSFTDKERETFEKEMQENYGYVSFDSCEKYIKKWMKENK